MKKITLFLLLIILTGCFSDASKDIRSDLDHLLENLDYKYFTRENTSTDLFSYYLPSDMSNEDGNTTSAVVRYNDSKVIINVNIASIVNRVSFGYKDFYDDGFFNDDLLIYEKNGEYFNDELKSLNYLLKVYGEGETYLVNLVTSDLNFFGITNNYDLIDLTKRMFVIAKSCAVDYDAINSNYSNKDIIEYVKQPVNLFEYDIPSSGLLSDLVNSNNGGIAAGEYSTSSISDDEPSDSESIEKSENESDNIE